MQVIHIMSGVPGCGKTTHINKYARNCDHVLHRDVLRANLREELNSTEYFPVPAAEEYNRWIDACAAMLRTYKDDGGDFWFDQTTLSNGSLIKFINALNDEVDLHPFTIVVECIHVPLDECLRRNAMREGFARVPDDTVKDMAKHYSINTAEVRAHLKPFLAERVCVDHLTNNKED